MSTRHGTREEVRYRRRHVGTTDYFTSRYQAAVEPQGMVMVKITPQF